MDEAVAAEIRRRIKQLDVLRANLKTAQDFEQTERAARLRASIEESAANLDRLRGRGRDTRGGESARAGA